MFEMAIFSPFVNGKKFCHFKNLKFFLFLSCLKMIFKPSDTKIFFHICKWQKCLPFANRKNFAISNGKNILCHRKKPLQLY